MGNFKEIQTICNFHSQLWKTYSLSKKKRPHERPPFIFCRCLGLLFLETGIAACITLFRIVFLYPLKTSENLWFSNVTGGIRDQWDEIC